MAVLMGCRLERFFILDDADRVLIGKRRRDHNRLGFSLLATAVRYLGVFLVDPLVVPWQVVQYLAAQLDFDDPWCVKRYTERVMIAYENATANRNAYGYQGFGDSVLAGHAARRRVVDHPRGPGLRRDVLAHSPTNGGLR